MNLRDDSNDALRPRDSDAVGVGRGRFPSDWRGLSLSRQNRGLILPSRPRRAIGNALSMVDAFTPVRAAFVQTARGLNRLGLLPLLPFRQGLDSEDSAWLGEWMNVLTNPGFAGAATMAVARRSGRMDLLLMDQNGSPLAFVKVGSDRRNRERMLQEVRIRKTVREGLGARVRIPRLLGDGELHGRLYTVFEPIVDGAHRRPDPDPDLVGAAITEVHERLSGLPRGASVPPHHVAGHGDFTHRNVRLGTDGALWLFDWEHVGWMPPLADELRYWTAHHAFSLMPRPARAAREIVRILRNRGSEADIAEAVAWPEFNRRPEQAIRQAVGALVNG